MLFWFYLSNSRYFLYIGTSDFFGVNYYSSRYVTSRSMNSNFIAENDIGFEESIDPAWPLSKSWHIYSVPEGLRALLKLAASCFLVIIVFDYFK